MSLRYPEEMVSRADALRARRARASGLAAGQAKNVIGSIIAIIVFAFPFDAILNLPPLGEMAHESYAAIGLACAPIIMFLMLYTSAARVPTNLLVIFALILLVVFASFTANFDTILSAVVKGRKGLDKLVTSALVPIFGMYIALLVYNVASWNFRRWFLLPLLAGAVVVLAVGAAEFAAAHLYALGPLYTRIYLMTHAGFGQLQLRMGQIEAAGAEGTVRITSVLFEPADFGTYLLYVTPWLLALYLSPRFAQRSIIPPLLRHLFYPPMICLAVVLAFFSGRTAAIGLPAVLLVFLMLCLSVRLMSDGRAFGLVSWSIVVGAALLYLVPLWLIGTFTNELASWALHSGSNSNVSRLGTIVILLNLFADNPLFGVGFGQYGFYVAQHVPGWAYTYEFKRWLGDINESFFPTFSIFARLAGETGLFGLMTWVGFLAYLLRKMTSSVRHSYLANRQFPIFGVALMTNFFSLGLTGLGMASFRLFWIWALLGLAACYIYRPFAIELQPADR
jgi:hypothetical protein